MLRFWFRHWRHGMLDLTLDPPRRPVFLWCSACQRGTYGKESALSAKQ